ncbi:hypothetical protein ES703_121892 [subsurface metagenome]
MIELKIKGFALDQNQMPIVILNDESGGHILPISIGPFEASAIIVELEDIKPPLPLTHDSFSNLMQRHGYKMDRLEIYDRLSQYIYLAGIRYHRGFRHFRMEIRPSDGLALAVRMDAPILAAEELLSPPADQFPIIECAGNISAKIMFLNTEEKRNTLIM